ncbi:MAG: FAD:protein FMN transferase [Acidobacteria bacterium]|nr:FAD:protein FMN transferase [Acidobacteriota bacterium]
MPVLLSRYAMATRFELVIYGDDPVRLRAAGEEALDEIERVEAQLSFYRSDSEIHWLNSRAAIAPVKVDPRLYRLLKRCAELSEMTDGAFDVSVGPLMRAWRFVKDKGAIPSQEELEAARAISGMIHIQFDDDALTVEFDKPGVEIDLGGYGKGYATERAVELLIENGIDSALLHGGTSSVTAIGAPPGEECWRIAMPRPFINEGGDGLVDLKDSSLSVSAAHGKSFEVDGRIYGHVIDPRSGLSVNKTPVAAALGPSASLCEALSKALMVNGGDWLTVMNERFPGYQAWTHGVPPHGVPPSGGTIRNPGYSA